MEIWEVWHPTATAEQKKVMKQQKRCGTTLGTVWYSPRTSYLWTSSFGDWCWPCQGPCFLWQRLRDKNLGRPCCIGSNMLNIISVNDSHSVWLLMHWHTLLGAKLRQSEMEMLWVRDSNRFLDSHLFFVAMGLMKILRRQSCEGLGIKDKDSLQPWYVCIYIHIMFYSITYFQTLHTYVCCMREVCVCLYAYERQTYIYIYI